jgi:hypothetical protein
MTTPVVARTWGQEGQETRRISAFTSSKYDLVRAGQLAAALVNSINDFEILCYCWLVQVFISAILAGAEGFEPPKAVLETAGLPLAYAPSLITAKPRRMPYAFTLAKPFQPNRKRGEFSLTRGSA